MSEPRVWSHRSRGVDVSLVITFTGGLWTVTPYGPALQYSNQERDAGHLVISNSNKYCFGTIFIVLVTSSSRILLAMHSKKMRLQERRRHGDFCALVVPSPLWFVLILTLFFFFFRMYTFHCRLGFCHNHEPEILSLAGSNTMFMIVEQ